MAKEQVKHTLYPVEYPDEQEFWDGERLFTMLGDCQIVMSSSIRNIGKTYSCFAHLRKHIELGHNVAVSRYDRVELGVTIQDFLRYYETKDEETGETVYGYEKKSNRQRETPYQCYEFPNGARVYFFAVKDSPNIKGLDITNLWRWYIDEFVPISYKVQTRKYNEFGLFRELYHSLLRRNGEHLRVIMTANVKKWMNPYYMGWGIPKFHSGNILKITRGDIRIAVENVKPSKAMAKAFVSAERLMGTSDEDIRRQLEDYDNDPDCFIDSKTNVIDLDTQVSFKERVYGIYESKGNLYFKRDRLNQRKFRYLLTPIEYNGEFVFDQKFVNYIEKMMEYNKVRFDCRETEFDIRTGVWLSHTKKV